MCAQISHKGALYEHRAIDQLTIERGQIGLVLDNAIELTPGELVSLGLVRSSTRGGYRGDYFVFEARSR